MAQIPNHLLHDWIERLNDVAETQNMDPGLASELRSLAARASAFLAEGPHGAITDRRRGLGRGLESLIPTGSGSVEDIGVLRAKLRRIAESASPDPSVGTEGPLRVES